MVREIEGVSPELVTSWSTRRGQIDARRATLAADFQAKYGRIPGPKEAIKLAQQATLETRDPKHEPRSLAEQRAAWRAQAAGVLGSPDAARAMVAAARAAGRRAGRRGRSVVVFDLAGQVQRRVEAERARWQVWHVRAEAERVVKAADVPAKDMDSTVDQVVAQVLDPAVSIRITAGDGIIEPAELRRADGSSVYQGAGSQLYTSARILAAEQALLAAARRTDGRVVPDTVVGVALLEQAANGPELNPAQTQLVTELATSGARVQLVLAPAGTGKTTALAVLARAWTDHGGTVIGLAPSAVAAAGLGEQIGAHLAPTLAPTAALDAVTASGASRLRPRLDLTVRRRPPPLRGHSFMRQRSSFTDFSSQSTRPLVISRGDRYRRASQSGLNRPLHDDQRRAP